MSENRITGQCVCGAVKVTATPLRPHVEVCHCATCRRWGGSAFLGLQCGSDVTFEGEEHIARYASSEWAERGFCKRCGSHLFFHFAPADNYGLLAGLFDDPGEVTMAEEIFIDQKPEYYDFAQDTKRRTGAEVIAEAEAAGFSFD